MELDGIKEIFTDIKFLLTLLNAIQCLVIVILWCFTQNSNGQDAIIFAFGSPAYITILWGLIISYILGIVPPYELHMIYSVLGACIFTAVGTSQLITVTDKYEKNMILSIALHLLVATTFLALVGRLHADKRIRKESLRPYIVYMSPTGVSLQKS